MTLFRALHSDDKNPFGGDFKSFVEDVHAAVQALNQTIIHYCENDVEAVNKSAAKVIHHEGRADQTRRDMERELYTGVLMPFGREDKYALIEAIDDIADKAELIVRLAKLERPKIPKTIIKELPELAQHVEETSQLLHDSVQALSADLDKAIAHASQVEIKRETVRMLEFQLLEKLFAGGKIDVKTILFKELISLVGQVADKCEEAADRVITLAVKYKD